VWAVEAKGFRSFRYDRVTNVEIIDKNDYKIRLGEFWKEID
jgi:predicted DNA-binding transcriptional regulator YafY